MRKLLWPARIGLVTLALVLMPAEAGDDRLSGAALCAAESDVGTCEDELSSFCEVDGEYFPDVRPN